MLLLPHFSNLCTILALLRTHFSSFLALRRCICRSLGSSTRSSQVLRRNVGHVTLPKATSAALSATLHTSGASPAALSRTRSPQMLRLKHFRPRRASSRYACRLFGPGQASEQHRTGRKSQIGGFPKRSLPDVKSLQDGPQKWPPWGAQGDGLPRPNKHFLQNSSANRRGKGAPRQNKHFLKNRTGTRQGKDAPRPNKHFSENWTANRQVKDAAARKCSACKYCKFSLRKGGGM